MKRVPSGVLVESEARAERSLLLGTAQEEGPSGLETCRLW
jgi:hypothetical protein